MIIFKKQRMNKTYYIIFLLLFIIGCFVLSTIEINTYIKLLLFFLSVIFFLFFNNDLSINVRRNIIKDYTKYKEKTNLEMEGIKRLYKSISNK